MQFILMPRNPLAIAALLAGEIDAAIIGPGHLVKRRTERRGALRHRQLQSELDFRH